MADGASSEFTCVDPQQDCPGRSFIAGVFCLEEITRPEAVHALSALFAKTRDSHVVMNGSLQAALSEKHERSISISRHILIKSAMLNVLHSYLSIRLDSDVSVIHSASILHTYMM